MSEIQNDNLGSPQSGNPPENNNNEAPCDEVKRYLDRLYQTFVEPLADIIVHPITFLVNIILTIYLYLQDPSATLGGFIGNSILGIFIMFIYVVNILHHVFEVNIVQILQSVIRYIFFLLKNLRELFVKTMEILFCLFGLDFHNLFGSSKCSNNNTSSPVQQPVKEKMADEEVFHIPGNHYTYNEAANMCQAHGARLASYDQMEDAYNDGAEWCSYGWSQGQMAFFPTQKSTYNELQKDPKRKNDCGRPGVNGGYMANPYIKFGVNCYGVKPDKTSKDKMCKLAPVKEEKPSVALSGFNQDTWSRYERV